VLQDYFNAVAAGFKMSLPTADESRQQRLEHLLCRNCEKFRQAASGLLTDQRPDPCGIVRTPVVRRESATPMRASTGGERVQRHPCFALVAATLGF
jgi:hypothetical protein